jgi:alpha-tubulin suppressor-like RCC1 family protein
MDAIMGSAFLNKIAGAVLAIFLIFFTALPLHAAEGDGGIPIETSLPLGCWVDNIGDVHSQLFGTGPEEIYKPFCLAADSTGITVIKPICQVAQSPWSSYVQLTKGITSFDCAEGQICDQGVCKIKPKPVGCNDSDFPGKSDTSTWGGWLSKYNPQIKTSGFVKTEDITGVSPQFFGDHCKDGAFIYEQTCTDAPETSNFQLKRKEVAVLCPTGFQCKEISVNATAIVDKEALGNGAPATSAACVPKPDPCEAPWSDMCPEIDGCQMDPGQCPPNKDICDSTLTKEQLQKKYGPATTIFPIEGGGWIADSCVTAFTIKHEWCDKGVPKIGLSPCPDGTCVNGLCNQKQVPPPGGGGGSGDGGTPPLADCEDTDIKGSTNAYGTLDEFGQIKIKSVAASAANDFCKTNKIVEQFKCDAAATAGFSGKTFTCTGKTECCDGKCYTPVKASCVEFPNDTMNSPFGEGVHGAGGNGKNGQLFQAPDKCTSDGKIAKVVCDIDSCSGFKTFEPEFCPGGKTCIDGKCQDPPKPQTCGPLPDGSGVGVVKDGKTLEYINACGNSIYTSFTCDATGNAVSTDSTCVLGCDEKILKCKGDGPTFCEDSDPLNKADLLGTVTWKSEGMFKNTKDFCEVSGKLVQVDCANNNNIYNAPVDCPASHICENGICVFKPECSMATDCNDNNACTTDSCITNKCQHAFIPIPVSTMCEKFSCDSVKGLVSTLQDLCPAGQKCDSNKQCVQTDPCTGKVVDDGNICTIDACTNGNVTHTPKCPIDTICNQTTGACEKPQPDPTKSVGYCADDAKCDDKNMCNGTEKCTDNKCMAGTSPLEGNAAITDTTCFDDDKDGITNSKDNCPKNYNPDQADINVNGKGDVCELSLSAGIYHACATYLTDDQGKVLTQTTLKCWGGNIVGSVGNGKTSSFVAPAQGVVSIAELPKDAYLGPTTPFMNIAKVSAGNWHTCALSADPTNTTTPYCWGSNSSGSLGFATVDSKMPAAYKISTPITTGVVDVAAGGASSCALGSDQHVYCWGNILAQDPLNMWTGTPIPTLVKEADGSPLSNIVSLSAGGPLVCGVTQDGTAKCWGKSFDGAGGTLADDANVTGHFNYPKLVASLGTTGNTVATAPPLTGIVKIATDGSRTCALLKDTSVACWGSEFDGKLGTDTSKAEGGWQKHAWPNLVLVNPQEPYSPPLKKVVDIAIGGFHTCAILQDGTVSCWGANPYGTIIPNATKADYNPPTQIKLDGEVIADAIQIAAGVNFTCVRLKNQSVKCWGDNDWGQLGYPPYGVPSCVVQDPYGLGAGCAKPDGTKAPSSALICDSYGTITCGAQNKSTSLNYKATCPTAATASDQPKCIEIDFGLPSCQGPVDTYGKPTPKCSNSVGKIGCDPYGKPTCKPQTVLINATLTCNDPNTPPSCEIQPSVCGNWKVEDGEQCDEGYSNGVYYSKCTLQCMWKTP